MSPEIEVERKDGHALSRIRCGTVQLVAAVDLRADEIDRERDLERAIPAIRRSVVIAGAQEEEDDPGDGTKYGSQGLAADGVDERLRTDGGDPTPLSERSRVVGHSCALCAEVHDSRAAALRCCSDRFDDGDDLVDGPGGEPA
mgnify:CR=1 FL=1